MRLERGRWMKQMGGLLLLALPVVAVAACAPPAGQEEASAPSSDQAMQLHHLHGLMAHGFEMGMEGASLTMLAQMSMTPAVDSAAAGHGEAMVADGHALVDDAMSGRAMTALHEAGGFDQEVMGYTHNLGQAMTAALDAVIAMDPVDTENPGAMALHHIHMMLGHAAQMAGQGTSLAMSASMDMAEAVDDVARGHGEAMIANARSLHEAALKGEAMQQLHAGDMPEGMQATHELGDAVGAVIDLLASMP